ncbi:thioester reductase domain-containing protein [Micromonospora sp. WMMD1120]|uniref:thioester reductase domain-containing protein n=1 Tax=Micromonospora sp. WMMD1120 TaxID=3016106 RepID=UPI002418082C|nr:thioester reductase domain-containing protein [Micromonospora sp. WMMD1120]MDG4810887.1 thioester reductase domain-containing protein [Micromonospora sp. WMMD1120]
MPEPDTEPGRNGVVDRRADSALIEGSGRNRAQAAELLARLRGPDAGAVPVMAAAPSSAEQVATAIVAAAGRFLRGVRADVDTDLFEAGLSSTDAVELVADLARRVGVRLSLDDVFADARPAKLARRWAHAAGLPAAEEDRAGAPRETRPTSTALTVPVRTPDEDIEMILEDLALADRLPWCEAPPPEPPRRILLTGANGFLGTHLLLDLLRRSDAHVVCLVRAADDEAARQRLGEGLRKFSLPWSAEVRRRVTVVAGDIREPHLGWSEQRWTELADDVDAIVNVAAAVDFLRGYPSLRRSNVIGPLRLAELAMTGRPKPLHHVSSVAVFNEVGVTSMGEDDPVAHITRLVAGYDKSKWAAEAALRRAREHGLVVTFLRPGAINGHTESGAYNAHDLSTGFLVASSRYRLLPAFKAMNTSPVDWVSRIAAAIVCDPDAWGRNYHLTGRADTLPEMVKDMKMAGMNVRVLGWEQWREEVLARQEADPVPELEFMARLLRNPAALKLCEGIMLGPASRADRTEAFIARHHLPMPARYDAAAQLRTFERMADDGRITLPSRHDQPYLWFSERAAGLVGAPGDEVATTGCTMALTLSVASMYQVVRQRRIDVTGTVACARLHAQPLTVTDGEIEVRPDEGVPHRHGTDHPLLHYRLTLVDADGGEWWLDGWKTARLRRDLWRQTRAIEISIGRAGAPAVVTGEVQVPSAAYLKDQVDGLSANPRLSAQAQRLAKITWLGWFYREMAKGLVEPALRAGADLLDLRRDAIDRDRDNPQRLVSKLSKNRRQLS